MRQRKKPTQSWMEKLEHDTTYFDRILDERIKKVAAIREQKNKDQITNKELQDLLKQYPDDAIVSIEYCNIRELKYYEDKNLIVID